MAVRFCLVYFMLALTACSTAEPLCPPPAAGNIVYVSSQGWHVEIGLPVEELSEDLAFYRAIFPGARVLVFGYGKKTFFIAPTKSWSEYVLGPFPGPAAIQVFGLRVPPEEAYPDETNFTLSLTPHGLRALNDYIWNDLTKDAEGKPQAISHSFDPEGLFYAAESEYNLLHTCNTWAIAALKEAGIPVITENVIVSEQAISRVEEAAKKQCTLTQNATQDSFLRD